MGIPRYCYVERDRGIDVVVLVGCIYVAGK